MRLVWCYFSPGFECKSGSKLAPHHPHDNIYFFELFGIVFTNFSLISSSINWVIPELVPPPPRQKMFFNLLGFFEKKVSQPPQKLLSSYKRPWQQIIIIVEKHKPKFKICYQNYAFLITDNIFYPFYSFQLLCLTSKKVLLLTLYRNARYRFLILAAR